MTKIKTFGLLSATATLGLFSTMCGSEAPDPQPGATGGTATTTGGTSSTGGTVTSGGTSTGGTSTGGTSTGGTSTGGVTGGTNTGGATGGASTTGGAGGAASGGTAGGNSSGGAGGASAGTSSGGNAGATGSGGEAGKAGGGAAGASSGGNGGMSTGGAGGSATGGGSTAGSSATGGSGGSTATFAAVAKILDTNCSKCHDGSKASMISLKNDPGLYGRLTTALPVGTSECVGQLPVDKSTPANGLIGKVIQGPVMTKDCSVDKMPAKGMLSAGDLATLTSWINAGAPQN